VADERSELVAEVAVVTRVERDGRLAAMRDRLQSPTCRKWIADSRFWSVVLVNENRHRF
jgi:hypothetical protein